MEKTWLILAVLLTFKQTGQKRSKSLYPSIHYMYSILLAIFCQLRHADCQKFYTIYL
jgi:hypothetical protein